MNNMNLSAINKKVCPKCGASYYSIGGSSTTCMYFEPIYKDGVNINPDRNITTTSYTCCECGHSWTEKSSGFEEDDYKTVGIINQVTNSVKLPEKSHASIDLGGFIVQVNHTYTEDQIAHIKDYFGWEVTNLD